MTVQAVTQEWVDMNDDAGTSPASEGQARASTYSLIAALLARPPSDALIRSLARIPQRTNHDDGSMALAWEALHDAGESAPTSEILKHEYHDLFIGVGRGELLPFGSWYQTGFLMDRPLSSLRDDLKRLGFKRQDDVKEPEDHIAALCETMAMLIEDQDIAFAQQRAFYQNHIDCWAGRFFSDLTQAENATFYRAVGDFGGHFIQFENRYFEMLT